MLVVLDEVLGSQLQALGAPMPLVWVGFYVHWSSVCSTEATFTTPATLPAWTNPTTCLNQR